jgi:hypothetical protein
MLAGKSDGWMSRVRMVARPSEAVSCRRPAGIHRARVGGSTHVAPQALTVSTPFVAQASWVLVVGVPGEAAARGHGEVDDEDRPAVVLSGLRHNMAAYALCRRGPGP